MKLERLAWRRAAVPLLLVGVAAVACTPEAVTGSSFGRASVGGTNSSAGRGSGGGGGVGGTSGAGAGGGIGGAAIGGGTAGTLAVAGNAGAPAGCTPIDDDTARVPYEPCTGNDCTLAESIAVHAELECSLGDPSERLVLVSGCGYFLLRWMGGFSGGAQVFDAATEREVGHSRFNDVPEPPCDRYRHVAGQSFPSDCETFTMCSVCDALSAARDVAGQAGAAGEGGGAGAAGAPSCLDGILE